MDRRAWRTTVHGVTKESHNLATNQLTIKITTLLLFNIFPSTFHQQLYTPKHYYQDSKAQEKYKPLLPLYVGTSILPPTLNNIFTSSSLPASQGREMWNGPSQIIKFYFLEF